MIIYNCYALPGRVLYDDFLKKFREGRVRLLRHARNDVQIIKPQDESKGLLLPLRGIAMTCKYVGFGKGVERN